MRRELGSELGVGRDRGVPDPIDGLDRVADPDRMDAPPRAGRPDPRVDLQMQMAVRITAASISSTGTCTCRPRGPTRVVA